jgi:hypothetical protein
VETTGTDVSGVNVSCKQPCKGRGESSKGPVSIPEGGSQPTTGSECVETTGTDVSGVNVSCKQPCKGRGESLKGHASVSEGSPEYNASSECVGSIEINVSSLKYTKNPQRGQALYSGRRRGRPRGHSLRGCGRSNSTQYGWSRARELDQSSGENRTPKV